MNSGGEPGVISRRSTRCSAWLVRWGALCALLAFAVPAHAITTYSGTSVGTNGNVYGWGVTDAYVGGMVHTAYVTATLRSPKGRRTSSNRNARNTVRADLWLAWDPTDFGNYIEEDEHEYYCWLVLTLFLLGYTQANQNVQPPSLACTTATRGQSATCTLSQSPPNLWALSDWRFKVGTQITVEEQNKSDSQWTGVIVQGGTVTVHAIGPDVRDVSASLNVNNRTGWAFTQVSASKVPNGSALCGGSPEVTTLTSPPVAGPNNEAVLAKFCLTVAYSFQTATVGGGPNGGYKYVTSVSSTSLPPDNVPTTFRWLRVPDLDSSSTPFYQAQCGNYDAVTNPNGFISGADLDSQTARHEAGSSASHWGNYKGKQDDPNFNLGTNAESQLGGPALSPGDFVSQVQAALDPKKNSIISAAQSENIPGVNYSSLGTLLGYVNYSPYASCH